MFAKYRCGLAMPVFRAPRYTCGLTPPKNLKHFRSGCSHIDPFTHFFCFQTNWVEG